MKRTQISISWAPVGAKKGKFPSFNKNKHGHGSSDLPLLSSFSLELSLSLFGPLRPCHDLTQAWHCSTLAYFNNLQQSYRYKKLIIFSSSEENRTSLQKNNTEHERNNSNCENSIVLPLINDVTDYRKIEKSILMIETSENPWLIARWVKLTFADESMTKKICPITQKYRLWDNCSYLCKICILTMISLKLRQACAVESAALRSGLGVTVVMLARTSFSFSLYKITGKKQKQKGTGPLQ